jgi:Flp pilus assembly protein TadD
MEIRSMSMNSSSTARCALADHEAMTIAGRQLSLTGQHREALRLLYDVAAMHPERASAHANLGLALLAAGHVQEAVRAFSRAIERLDGADR